MKAMAPNSLRAACLMALAALPAMARTTITLDEAVKRALATSPQLLAAKERTLASEDQAGAVRGQLLPSAVVSGEYQHYDSPFAIAFSVPGAPPGPALVVRGQNTTTVAVAGRQPL